MPTFTQRDIVRLKNPIRPEIGPHPCIILSCSDAIVSAVNGVCSYTGVMLTHSKVQDRFTFLITKEMVDGQWDETRSQARVHILMTFTDNDLQDKDIHIGKVTKPAFRELLERINSITFKVD